MTHDQARDETRESQQLLTQRLLRAAFLVTLAFASVAQAQPCPADLMPLTQAIVKVWCGGSGGSGTLVYAKGDEGYVITCRHVVGGNRTATAEFRTGYKSTGPVVGRGQSYDQAVIKIRPPAGATVIPVADEPAPQGAIVHGFGYGGQYGIPIQRVRLIHWQSKLHGYKRSGDGTSLIKLDPWAQSGDSGGPVVYNGRLVGLIQGGELAGYNGRPLDTHGAYSTPIRNLLQSIAPQAVAGVVIQQQPGGT